MKQVLLYVCCTLFICIPISAQDTLYPVRGKTSGLDTMHVEADADQREHTRWVAEKTFEYKLMVEFPTEDEAGFLPESEAKIVMFWLRVENLSQQPRQLNTTNFTLTDETGQSYALLAPEAAFDRIAAGMLGRNKFFSNTAKGISLGRNGVSMEELKDETLRFSFKTGDLIAQGVKQGLLFFEAPARKKFTVNLKLGELWSRPFVFSSEKPKR